MLNALNRVRFCLGTSIKCAYMHILVKLKTYQYVVLLPVCKCTTKCIRPFLTNCNGLIWGHASKVGIWLAHVFLRKGCSGQRLFLRKVTNNKTKQKKDSGLNDKTMPVHSSVCKVHECDDDISIPVKRHSYKSTLLATREQKRTKKIVPLRRVRT